VLARTIGDPRIVNALRDTDAPMPLPVAAYTHEPNFDVFEEGHEILIVSELPGVGVEQIRIYGYTTQVVVHVRGHGSRYSVRLPLQIEPTSISFTIRNSILEVRAGIYRAAAAE
jgi:HSP20 family molecular chaperone IbpA